MVGVWVMSWLKELVTQMRTPPQSLPLAPDQVPNSAGGYAWALDDWARLRRWLVLGSEGGSYYAGQRELTLANIAALSACLAEDGPRAVAEIVAISEAGRAPKNDPAVFALAAAAGATDEATRAAALAALPRVCRTGTHLFQFVTFVEAFRGWGRGLRRAVGRWYADRPADELAYQLVKYRQRDGVTHRDVLRLAHPAAAVSAGNPTVALGDAQRAALAWAAGKPGAGPLPRLIEGYERVQAAGSDGEAAALVREYRLPREALPTERLTSPLVWEALLADMPMTAMIRNLATLTRVGLLVPGSDALRTVVERLGDGERLRHSRVHPVGVLAALVTYAGGEGARSAATWTPVPQVVDALDGAFYAAFGNVQPMGRRTLLALDVSSSMSQGTIAGIPGLTPRVAAAAMALVTARTEPDYMVMAFATQFIPLALSPRQRLDDVVALTAGLPFGGTDCAQPMLHAREAKLAVDAFVVYTDSETWAGAIHPATALARYREATGIPARLAVVGMVSNAFTIADPADPGMLDVVGFDTATPALLADFLRGDV
jgi:60 kDa SS-A/Ro ribonucleoprotein